MKKLLQIIGTLLYSNIAAYLCWLVFYFATPYIMAAKWWMIILYFFVGIFIGIQLCYTLATVLSFPLIFLTKDNMTSKVINCIVFLFWGYSTVMLPFHLDMEFGFKEYVLIFFYITTIIPLFACFVVPPFMNKES